MLPGPSGRGRQVALLFVKERGAIREQELKVTKLREVDPMIVDLGDDAPPQGEPETGIAGVGGPNAVLVAVGPGGFDARTAESNPVSARLQASLGRVLPSERV